MSLERCPACKKLVSTRFPMHDCRPVKKKKAKRLVRIKLVKSSWMVIYCHREKRQRHSAAGFYVKDHKLAEVVEWVTVQPGLKLKHTRVVSETFLSKPTEIVCQGCEAREQLPDWLGEKAKFEQAVQFFQQIHWPHCTK